jgi:hypothetical protein
MGENTSSQNRTHIRDRHNALKLFNPRIHRTIEIDFAYSYTQATSLRLAIRNIGLQLIAPNIDTLSLRKDLGVRSAAIFVFVVHLVRSLSRVV